MTSLPACLWTSAPQAQCVKKIAQINVGSPAAATPPKTRKDTGAAPRHADNPSVIVVVGKTIDRQNLPDRKSYDVAASVHGASGSAADVLRDIPSLEVSAQGEVSVRGDSNVQVLIDGKKSTAMSSRNLANSLAELPADAIARVEVITTPGARFHTDGSGGIINIITRQSRQLGTTASLHANAATDGSFYLGAKVTRRTSRLTASVSLDLNQEVRWHPFHDHRIERNPTVGSQTILDQSGIFTGPRLARTLAGSIDYDLTNRDHVGLQASYIYRTGVPRIAEDNLVTDPAGAILAQFHRAALGDEDEYDSSLSASYLHRFGEKGRSFTLNLRRDETLEPESRRFRSDYTIPLRSPEIDEVFPRAQEIQRELTVEYKQPLLEGSLVLGYDLQRNDDDFQNRGFFIDPTSEARKVDPSRTNRFRYRETVHAWYGTFHRDFGEKLSGDFGLRLEETTTRGLQFDLGLSHRSSYFRAYPSLHLQYDLPASQKLRLNYSQRIVRPDPEDLDPFPVFTDPLSIRAGNPGLKPEESRIIELEYEHNLQGGTLDLTAYYKRTRNKFTFVNRLNSSNVVVTTHENLGSSTTMGIDASGQVKLPHAISLNLSGSLYRETENAANLGYAGSRSEITGSAKGDLSVAVGKAFQLQLSASYQGRELLSQGYRLPTIGADLGVSHTFANGLQASLTLSDIFDSRRERVAIFSSNLVENLVRRRDGRHISFALSLPLGHWIGRP